MPRHINVAHSLLLGFEGFDRLLERASKAGSEGYPPFNIEHLNDRQLKITLAVAGFTIDDLDILLEENQLVVKGKQREESDREFLHRGIANRQFIKKFVIAEPIEVMGANLHNGLLDIYLEKPEPESRTLSIPIKEGPVEN